MNSVTRDFSPLPVLNHQIPKMEDHDSLKSRIQRVWITLEKEKQSGETLPFKSFVVSLTLEEQFLDMLSHLSGTLKNNHPSILKLREDLQHLEKNELLFFVLEALIEDPTFQKIKIDHIWLSLFPKVDKLGSFQNEENFQIVALYLFKELSTQNFISFLKAFQQSVDSSRFQKFLSLLFQSLSGKKELFLKVMLENGLKKEAWTLCLEEIQALPLSQEKSSLAIPFLKEDELSEEISYFYQTEIFKECQELYHLTYSLARKSSQNLPSVVSLHRKYLSESQNLKQERIQAFLAKLKVKGFLSLPLLNELLDEIDLLQSSALWSLFFEKLLIKSSTDMKKKAFQVFVLNSHLFSGEKTYPKICLEAVKLIDDIEALSEESLASLVNSLNPKNQISFHKELMSIGKKSTQDVISLVNFYQKFLGKKGGLPVESVMELASYCFKLTDQTKAFELLQSYLNQPEIESDKIKQIGHWFNARLESGPFKKNGVSKAFETIEKLIELLSKSSETSELYNMSENLLKSNEEFKDLALVACFKALEKTLKESLETPSYFKRLQSHFDLINQIVPLVSQKGFLNFLNQQNIEEFEGCYKRKIEEKWVEFWSLMIRKSLRIESSDLALTYACRFWNHLRPYDVSLAEDLAIEMTEYVIEFLDQNENEKFEFLSSKLVESLQEKLTYRPEKEGRIAQCRPVDLVIGQFFLEASKNKQNSFVLLKTACHIVKNQKFIRDFSKTKVVGALLETCLKKVAEFKKTESLESQEVALFLTSCQEFIESGLGLDFLDDPELYDKREQLIAVFAPSLFKIALKQKEKRKCIESFQEFYSLGQTIFQQNEKKPSLQKLLFRFAIDFAIEYCDDVEDSVLIEAIEKTVASVEYMLTFKVKEESSQKTISIESLSDLIDLYDFASLKLSTLKLSNDTFGQNLLSILLKMADFQINYRKSEKNKQVLRQLLDTVEEMESILPVYASKIVQCAIDLERKEPLKEFKDLKIVGYAFSSSLNHSTLHREGIKNLFKLLEHLNDTIDERYYLFLSGEFLSAADFKEFRNKEHCLEMMNIFLSVMKQMRVYSNLEMLSDGVYEEVFFGLLNKPIGVEEDDELSYDQINTLEELLGTDDEECQKKARKIINEIIGCFFELCGKDGAYFSQMKEKEYCFITIDSFLKDCEERGYLDMKDIKKWREKADPLEAFWLKEL